MKTPLAGPFKPRSTDDRRAHFRSLVPLGLLLLSSAPANAGEPDFIDSFQGKFGPGWSWVREHKEAWRLTPRGLEVRIEPGNMWGPANDAHNLLLHSAPDPANGPVEMAVTVENYPTNQYEQVDLTWYFNDSNMVKLGEELVDGQLSIVMGREEQDKTRTIKIVPLQSNQVRLSLRVEGDRIQGRFQPAGASAWTEVGSCDLPPATGLKPKVCLQFYQGSAEAEHWAKVTAFELRQLPPK